MIAWGLLLACPVGCGSRGSIAEGRLEQLLMPCVCVFLAPSYLAHENELVSVKDCVHDAELPDPQSIYWTGKFRALWGTRLAGELAQCREDASSVRPGQTLKVALSLGS